MLLAVPALALLSAPAMARPDHDAPPHALKAEVQVHMATFSDGRGETRSIASDRRDAYDRASSRTVEQRPHDSYGRESHAVLPFKAEVQQRLQNGDSREGNAAKPAARTTATESRTWDSYGRQDKPAPIPMKTQISMRLQGGDNRDSSPAAKSNPAARNAADKGEHQAPLTRAAKEQICKNYGVCMPLAFGSDDVEDKTE
jgi:hypothetical protein